MQLDGQWCKCCAAGCEVLTCQVPKLAKTMGGKLWVRYHWLPTRQSEKLWQHGCWLRMCSVHRAPCSAALWTEYYWTPPVCAPWVQGVPDSELRLDPWASGLKAECRLSSLGTANPSVHPTGHRSQWKMDKCWVALQWRHMSCDGAKRSAGLSWLCRIK